MKLKNVLAPFALCLVFITLTACTNKKEGGKDQEIGQTVETDAQETTYTYEGETLKVGVVGLVHDHVHWILGREKFGDIDLVGIVEPNRQLAQKYSKQYGFSMDMVYDTMDELVDQRQPEAIMAFNSIYDHLSVVEFFAPKGIPIMVEKPLAVNLDHAEKMIALANKHSVPLLTNYETSWYGSNYKAYDIVHKGQGIGAIRRIVFNTGHPGPIEIGCSKEFTEWLTDPEMNGAGSLTDFGCYGANLATWFMQGETPLTVSCVTQQIKPDLYPKVEDDATIILTYPETQVTIQASWNWSHNRKDMEIYGKTGYVICKNGEDMQLLENEKEGPHALKAKKLPKGIHDPFAFFAKVVKEDYKVASFSPSSLDNNLIVMQILEAAKHASNTGQTVVWDDFFPEH